VVHVQTQDVAITRAFVRLGLSVQLPDSCQHRYVLLARTGLFLA